jgi:Domain of unknown function (DUF4440)
MSTSGPESVSASAVSSHATPACHIPTVEGANTIALNRTLIACLQRWPYRAFPSESLWCFVRGGENIVVTKLIYRLVLACFVPLLLVTLPVSAAVQPDEASLRAADAEELQDVLTGDANAMRSLMHPNYMVNSPVNQIVRKDQLIKLLSEGKIASESIERTIEATAITGNVGIVMGRETIKPKPNSELGLAHGVKTLERRFTNVFVFEQGIWRLLARQSTVIQASSQ